MILKAKLESALNRAEEDRQEAALSSLLLCCPAQSRPDSIDQRSLLAPKPLPACPANPQLLSICSWTASRAGVGTGSNGPQAELWSHGGSHRSSGDWTPVHLSCGTPVFLLPALILSFFS